MIARRYGCIECGVIFADRPAFDEHVCQVDPRTLVRSMQQRAERAEAHVVQLQAIIASHETDARVQSEERRTLEEQRDRLRIDAAEAHEHLAAAESTLQSLSRAVHELRAELYASRDVIDFARGKCTSALLAAKLADFDARFPARRTDTSETSTA